jgi:hypothetical protein
MINHQATARKLARELLERETVGMDEPAALGAAMQLVCTRVSENLRRTIGDDGYNALLVRALARTRSEQPGLGDLEPLDAAQIYVDGIAASVATHGSAVVSAALESLIAALLDILSDLIGADMAVSLVEQDGPSQSRSDRSTP